MTGQLAQIYRHPIKGHGRESLASVALTVGECVPWDRYWAVAHDAAKLTEGWNPCVNFARGAKAPALMAVTSRLDTALAVLTLAHPDLGELSFRPDEPADLPKFLDWVAPLNPPDRARPVQIVSAGRGMTDTDYPSISILSLSSLSDLSARMGQDLSPHRWRGNLWIDGAAPWAEFEWVGRHLRVGGAVLRIEERIERCRATAVDPATGHYDGDTLAALSTQFGHQDFGIFATVLQAGSVTVGDGWSVE